MDFRLFPIISKNNFKNALNEILKEGSVEGYLLKCDKSISLLLNNEKLVNKFYKEFKDNYNIIYGKDKSNILLKLQDFVFRLDLFCMITTNENDEFIDLDKVTKAIMENDFDLYSGVSYSAEEMREILEDYFYTLSQMGDVPF